MMIQHWIFESSHTIFDKPKATYTYCNELWVGYIHVHGTCIPIVGIATFIDNGINHPQLPFGALANHIRGVHNRKLPMWGNRSPPQSYLEGHTLATLWTG